MKKILLIISLFAANIAVGSEAAPIKLTRAELLQKSRVMQAARIAERLTSMRLPGGKRMTGTTGTLNSFSSLPGSPGLPKGPGSSELRYCGICSGMNFFMEITELTVASHKACAECGSFGYVCDAHREDAKMLHTAPCAIAATRNQRK